MLYVIILAAAFIAAFFILKPKPGTAAPAQVPVVNDAVLQEHILFYSTLSAEEKQSFQKRVSGFLAGITITPVNTELTDLDRIFIGAGAIIPVFRFPDWEYINLREVLVYNDTFNMDFQSEGNEDRNIAGLVGTGVYNRKMFLSRAALRESFDNKTDKRNTVVHEFVHLIDKTDGDTDGIPELLLDKQYVLPWLDIMHKEMQQILHDDSDIDDYGLTNKSELFAVASEYFFERPELLEQKHPQLYAMLQRIFIRKAG